MKVMSPKTDHVGLNPLSDENGPIPVPAELMGRTYETILGDRQQELSEPQIGPTHSTTDAKMEIVAPLLFGPRRGQ